MKERLLEGLHEIGVTVHENGSLSEPVYFMFLIDGLV